MPSGDLGREVDDRALELAPQGHRLGLPQRVPPGGVEVALGRVPLDVVQGTVQIDHRLCAAVALLEGLHEPTPSVVVASDAPRGVGSDEQRVDAGVAVVLDVAASAFEDPLGVRPLPVGCERGIGDLVDVPEVEPLASGLDVGGVVCVASAHGGVIEADQAACQQLAVARGPQDAEHVAGPAEPVVQGRGRKIDVLAPKLLGEALDRVAVEHLADCQLGEQARRRHAAGNRLWRLRRLRSDDDFATAAAVLVDPLLEDVDLRRLVNELADVEAHLGQLLGASRTLRHLGLRNLDLIDLAAQPSSAPLTMRARAPPAGRLLTGRLVAFAGLGVAFAGLGVVSYRLLAKAASQHPQQLERELALGSLVLLGTKRRARVPAQLRAQARQLAVEAGEQRDYFVEDARLFARDRAPERAERGDRAFDLLASVRCHVDST
ncbi:MAG TPA: hypothetical protein VF469_23380 [Kofleriaceae bacterium]